MGISVSLRSFSNLAQNAEMHMLRLSVFNITGMTGGAANSIPYATLFPDVGEPAGVSGDLPFTSGPIAVIVQPLSPDGSTAAVSPTLDSTNGGKVGAGTGLGWDDYTTAGTGNVYVLAPASTTTCQLVFVY